MPDDLCALGPAIQQKRQYSRTELSAAISKAKTQLSADYAHDSYITEADCKTGQAAPKKAKMRNEAEFAAFENWLTKESPSGDCDEVQRKWLKSDAYADFTELQVEPAQEKPAEPTALGDGWIAHDGSEKAPSGAVMVRFRSGYETCAASVNTWGKFYDSRYEVIAYRLI
jgi:hypothetical protein